MTGILSISLRRAAQIRGNHPAFRCNGDQIDWLTLLDRASRVAAGLGDLGMAPGDRLAVLLPNGLVGVELFAAAVLSGIVIVPLNYRWTVGELVEGLNDCSASALVVDDSFRDTGTEAAMQAGVKLIDAGMVPATDAIRYETLFRLPPATCRNCNADDLLAIFYTSGTTSRPKGVMLSHGNITYVALGGMAEGFYGQDELYLHACPTFHIAGAMNIFQSFIAAAQNVLLPRFDAGVVLSVIATERVTQSLLVPTMINMILTHPDFDASDTSSMRQILYGAAPITPALLDRAMTAFPQVHFTQLYGMTETASNACILHSSAFARSNGKRALSHSVGRAMIGSELAIVSPQGEHLPPGEVGEIAIRGPGVMLGYWNRPDATAEAIHDGWMHTGDGGYLDTDGYLYLADRIKDMIVSGGENIYSLEVESVLVRHPAVLQCAVVGIPHPIWGEAVHAVVVVREGRSCEEQELIEFCRGLLAGYKLPRSVEFRTELPLTAAGKVLKRDLRASFTTPDIKHG